MNKFLSLFAFGLMLIPNCFGSAQGTCTETVSYVYNDDGSLASSSKSTVCGGTGQAAETTATPGATATLTSTPGATLAPGATPSVDLTCNFPYQVSAHTGSVVATYGPGESITFTGAASLHPAEKTPELAASLVGVYGDDGIGYTPFWGITVTEDLTVTMTTAVTTTLTTYTDEASMLQLASEWSQNCDN